jgi:hypothetical protein
MKNLISDIALFVPAIGAILLGPVWTMTIPPESFVESYVSGVIDALSVGFAIMWSYSALRIISNKD